MSGPDPIGAFREAVLEAGLRPGEIIPDGRIHRCGTGERPKGKDGWFVFFSDPPAGAFGDWRTGARQTWSGGNGREPDPETRKRLNERIEEDKRARQVEEVERQARVAEECVMLHGELPDATDENPYLAKKGVKAVPGLKADGDVLVVSVQGSGGITSLQRIDRQGGKLFTPGGKVQGGCFPIKGSDDGPIFVAEGPATALSIHEATGSTVLCAFSSGNLLAVARMARKKYPRRQITICSDDDRTTAEKTGNNPGIEKAMEAAKAVGGRVARPGLDGDFNDVHQAHGLEAVRKALESPEQEPEEGEGRAEKVKTGPEPLTIEEMEISRFLDREPEPIQYIFEEILPAGITAETAAGGGTGKSFFMVGAGMSAAASEPIFHKHLRPSKPHLVLYVAAEDPEPILHSRVFHTFARLVPEGRPDLRERVLRNFHVASAVGRIGPLMMLDNGNPIKSPWWEWLYRTVEAMGGVDLLMLDPKSRLYGLDEISNDHNTAWVACLEEINRVFGCTTLFSHHVSKKSGGALEQGSSRGGSALTDGCRWVSNLRELDEKTAQRFGVSRRDFVEFDISKNNYSPHLPARLYWKRADHGVLVQANLEFGRVRDKARELCAVLAAYQEDGTRFSRRDLREKAGKSVRDDLGTTTRETMDAVDHALKSGWLKSVTASGFGKGRREVLEATVEG